VQDAAYGTLLRSPRQQLHERIARTLEEKFSEAVEGQPELLARHCAEAGLHEHAIKYCARQARKLFTGRAIAKRLGISAKL